jgi:5-methylcytosine-specific restriction endonuclease McrA
MSSLDRIVAAHPLKKKPYNAIKFSRVDGYGTPLYRVSGDKMEVGARVALRIAAEKFGGHCFYCDTFMEPDVVPAMCTNDHVQPHARGGRDFLHNLVFACVSCNREKRDSDIVSFDPDDAIKYLAALSQHVERCLEELGKNKTEGYHGMNP